MAGLIGEIDKFKTIEEDFNTPPSYDKKKKVDRKSKEYRRPEDY